jgi:thiol-disulfide isomerase/thioredoxin
MRVALPTALGERVLWIDAENYLLRRVELPAEEAKKAFAWHPQLNIASVRLEFEEAMFEADDDVERYRMNVSDDAVLVSAWLPRPPLPPRELFGQTVADFHFTDLEGQEITASSLADKIVVLDFWATWCKPCLESLPKFNPLLEKYKDQPKVQFLAVNTEEPSTGNEQIRSVLANSKIKMRPVRDLASFSRLTFNVDALPMTIIFDGNGKVHFIETITTPDAIEKTIDGLLAGEDLAAAKIREYRTALAEREKQLSRVLIGGSADAAPEKIAPKSQPRKLRLTKLWSLTDLIQPGQIVVAESDGGAPRVYIHDGWNAVAEIGLDGKVAETYDLDLPEDSPVSNSRTVVDKSGNRHFVAFATRQEQVHVFDNLWKHRFSYPDEDVAHPGVANVLLADLDGDAQPEINISFWGVAGIQALSFEGKRLWPKRLIKSLSDIRGLAVTGADDKGQRRLVASHYDPTLAVFAYGGERLSDIVVPNQILFDVFSAEFDGAQKYCVLASGAKSQIAALGIDEKGEVLWTHELPGVPELVIEHVSTGMLPTSSTSKARHWVLLAPDSSIQFIDAEGELLDQFNYGSQLRAIAVVEHNGKSILLASTSESVDAWELGVSEGAEDEGPEIE